METNEIKLQRLLTTAQLQMWSSKPLKPEDWLPLEGEKPKKFDIYGGLTKAEFEHLSKKLDKANLKALGLNGK